MLSLTHLFSPWKKSRQFERVQPPGEPQESGQVDERLSISGTTTGYGPTTTTTFESHASFVQTFCCEDRKRFLAEIEKGVGSAWNLVKSQSPAIGEGRLMPNEMGSAPCGRNLLITTVGADQCAFTDRNSHLDPWNKSTYILNCIESRAWTLANLPTRARWLPEKGDAALATNRVVEQALLAPKRRRFFYVERRVTRLNPYPKAFSGSWSKPL